MTRKEQDLIPKKTSESIKEILRPLNPDACEAAIIFLTDEINQMFRELSEKRSASEGAARQVLARREARVLAKLQELFPEAQAQVEDVYALMRNVIETHFERQKGKKYL